MEMLLMQLNFSRDISAGTDADAIQNTAITKTSAITAETS
jgi:hypothetical protein